MPISPKECKQCQIDKFNIIPYQIISNEYLIFFRQFGSILNNPFFKAVINHYFQPYQTLHLPFTFDLLNDKEPIHFIDNHLYKLFCNNL